LLETARTRDCPEIIAGVGLCHLAVEHQQVCFDCSMLKFLNCQDRARLHDPLIGIAFRALAAANVCCSIKHSAMLTVDGRSVMEPSPGPGTRARGPSNLRAGLGLITNHSVGGYQKYSRLFRPASLAWPSTYFS